MPRKRIPRSPEEEAARKAERKVYLAAWKRLHPNAKKDWDARNKAHVRAYEVAWRKAHPEKVREQQRRTRQKNPEKRHASYKTSRLKKPDFYIQSHRKSDKKWSENNPEKRKASAARRNALKAAAPINDFTPAQWRALCKAAGYLCCYCGKKFPSTQLTPDHLTPYAKQGSNTLHNILPCCGSCNSRKKDRAVLRPVQPFLLVDDSAAD